MRVVRNAISHGTLRHVTFRAIAITAAVLASAATPVSPLRSGVVHSGADGYHPLTPARILDTREGLGAAPTPVGSDGVIELDVTGVGGVPDDGVAAVVFNLTGTNPTAATFVAAYPAGGERDGSNLNLLPTQTDSSLVVAAVGEGGRVALFNRFGTVDLIADVAGWFPTGSAYEPLAPARIVDTRVGTGAPAAPVGPDANLDVVVTGVGGVPSSGVGAVVLNVTGTNPSAATFVAAYPAGGERDGSNLNLLPAQTDSSLVIATVGDGGKVSLYNRFGAVDLIVDVAGWFPAGSDYAPLPPTRVLDTRSGVGAPAAAVGEDAVLGVQVTGVGGVPSTGVGAVVVNLTATEPTRATFVAAYPSGGAREGSNVNLLPGQTTSNLAIVPVGPDGTISLYNRFGSTHLIADITGWFPGGATGGTHPGTLWALGNGTLWRYNLATGTAWERRGDYGNAATVDLPRNEWISVDGLIDPLTITMRNLDTNVVTDSFVWDTTAWDSSDISASPDGRYLALVADRGSLETWIEIIDRRDGTVTDLGWATVAREVEFASNGDLLVLFDDTYEELYPWRAAIGVITKDQIAAGDASDIGLLQAFADADGVPGCLRVSPGGTISYGLAEALHVRELDGSVHQLTSSASGDAHACGVFSPDESAIAFVQQSIAAQYQRQYVIPNHRGAPIVIDVANGGGDDYVLAVDNLVSSTIAWQ